jgi:hypothetical protein
MATFVHLTDIRNSQKIMRNGIRPTMTKATGKVVYCVPVVSNFQITFQWLRELKREGYRTASAIQFKIADTEHVLVGRYRQPKSEMTAAQDVAFFQGADDARGYEVIIARGIKPKEITRRYGQSVVCSAIDRASGLSLGGALVVTLAELLPWPHIP